MNTKVTIPCRTIRKLAWQMGKNSYWECVFIALCCTIIQGSLSFIVSSFTSNDIILAIVDGIEFIITAIVNLGLANMFIKVFRGYKPSVDMITEIFPDTGNAVITEIVSFVRILLRTILLIVPGIFEAIRNSLTNQVRADNPGISPSECIRRSHAIMEGNKWKFVKLLLSFIGWMLLSELPCNIYLMIAHPELSQVTFDMNFSSTLQSQMEMMARIETSPMFIILSALTILVEVYVLMSVACFYDLASGNLVVQDETENYSEANYEG